MRIQLLIRFVLLVTLFTALGAVHAQPNVPTIGGGDPRLSRKGSAGGSGYGDTSRRGTTGSSARSEKVSGIPRARLVKFQENGKSGLKLGDSIITPAIYDWIDYNGIWSGRTTWIRKDGKYGLLLKSGKELIPCEYDDALDDVEFSKRSLFRASKGGFYGVIDTNNNLVIPAIYDYISDDRYGYIVKKDGKYGFLDTQGNTLLPLEMESVYPIFHSSDILLYRNKGLTGLMGEKGNHLVPQNLSNFYPLTDMNHCRSIAYKARHVRASHWFAYVMVDQNGQCGAIDLERKKIIFPCRYDAIIQGYYDGTQGIFIVRQNDKYGLVDATGEFILPCKFDSLKLEDLPTGDEFSETLLIAMRNGKYALIKANGVELTKYVYTSLNAVSHGFSIVSLMNKGLLRAGTNGYFVLMNGDGKILSKEHFDHIGYYAGGVAAGFLNGKICYISEEGIPDFPANGIKPFQGFTSLTEVEHAFMAAMTDPNDSVMMEFARKISPSPYTVDFMKRTGFSYRGIPDRMSGNDDCEKIVNSMYEDLLRLKRNRFWGRKVKTCHFENDYVMDAYVEGNVKFHESQIIIVFDDGSETTCKLGELLRIDGFWISFTRPN